MTATSLLETKELAKFRYDMMLKGFMNKSELKKFLQVGEKRAVKAWDKMHGMQEMVEVVLVIENILQLKYVTQRAVELDLLMQKKMQPN